MNCPVCDRDTVERVTRVGLFPVKNKEIEVEFELYVCSACHVEYYGGKDPFVLAHRKYRELYK